MVTCTPTTREQHRHEELSNSTDPTDAEGVVIGPLLPPAFSTGRPRSWSMREIMNSIISVLRGGIAWRRRPEDLPPKSTVSSSLLKKAFWVLEKRERMTDGSGSNIEQSAAEMSFSAAC